MNPWRVAAASALLACLLVVVASCDGVPAGETAVSSTRPIERISPEAAKQKFSSGEALMVCSYDDQGCSQIMIPGAITRDELARRKASLPKTREIIFYCA